MLRGTVLGVAVGWGFVIVGGERGVVVVGPTGLQGTGTTREDSDR